MVKATPEKYLELGSFNPGMCMMTAPAFAGGKLYLRLLGSIACYDLQDHGLYLDNVAVTKDNVSFHFKQTGGGLVAKDLSAVKIAETARPAKARIDGDNLIVDIKDVPLPFSISYLGAKGLAGKNGLPVPGFGWNDARLLKLRKCFDNSIFLKGNLLLRQSGVWKNPESFEVDGAKVVRVALDPEGKGVTLVTDKVWKPGDALTLTYPCFSVDQGEPSTPAIDRRCRRAPTCSGPVREG